MKINTNLALIVSLIILIGIPLLFLIVSLITGQWLYLLWSIPPSFLAGFTGLIVLRRQSKKGME